MYYNIVSSLVINNNCSVAYRYGRDVYSASHFENEKIKLSRREQTKKKFDYFFFLLLLQHHQLRLLA